MIKDYMGNKCCQTTLTEQNIKDILSEHGLNKTKVKIEILQIISLSKIPISVPEIHQKLTDKCDLSTVYRKENYFRS